MSHNRINNAGGDGYSLIPATHPDYQRQRAILAETYQLGQTVFLPYCVVPYTQTVELDGLTIIDAQVFARQSDVAYGIVSDAIETAQNWLADLPTDLTETAYAFVLPFRVDEIDTCGNIVDATEIGAPVWESA